MNACRICGNSKGNKRHSVHEMMFGWRDLFEYAECSECGCLQIADVPFDLARYYPRDYYSFGNATPRKENSLKSFLKHQRADYCLHGKNLLGMVTARIYGEPEHFGWLKKVHTEFESSILDVGCGSGKLLQTMQLEGFSNLTGTDPFGEDDLFHLPSLRVLNSDISDLQGQFDFIMLHHSLEHMPKPIESLKQLHRLLRNGGHLLVRTPIASSYAWDTYGPNWVQLDAPRHLFIYTVQTLRELAQRVGFEVEDIVYDSTEFQFWGSEQYLRNIPLNASNSYHVNPAASIFSPEQIASFKLKAEELNRNKKGDSACFYLYKKASNQEQSCNDS